MKYVKKKKNICGKNLEKLRNMCGKSYQQTYMGYQQNTHWKKRAYLLIIAVQKVVFPINKIWWRKEVLWDYIQLHKSEILRTISEHIIDTLFQYRELFKRGIYIFTVRFVLSFWLHDPAVCHEASHWSYICSKAYLSEPTGKERNIWKEKNRHMRKCMQN